MEQKKKYASPQMKTVDLKHRTCLLGQSYDVYIMGEDDDDSSSGDDN